MILCVFLVLLFLTMLAIGLYAVRRVLYITVRPMEKILQYESENHRIDPKWFEELNKEKVIITSPFGYRLSGFFIPGPDPSGKTVILCHGVTANHFCTLKFARMYLQRGWNVFVYDHRRHGDSEGPTTTFGFYEKHDLKAVVAYVRNRLDPGAVLGLHGESMGAATILQYGALEDRADFFISDCAYSSLWEQFSIVLKKDYHLSAFPVMYITDWLIRLKERFRIKDVCPLNDVKKIQKPILFIHGDADPLVPAKMSERMYSVKEGFKELYLAPGAAHAKSFTIDPQRYEEVCFSFLKRAGIE